MRDLRASLAREGGQAMVLALFTFALLATTALTLTDVVTGASIATGQAAASSGAYEAAEAGVDEYVAKLLDDPLYYQHEVDEAESTRLDGSSSLTVAAGNAWTGGVSWSYPDGQNTWKQLGNGYAYNLEITPPSESTTLIDEAVQIFSTGCRWSTATAACATGEGYAQREIQTVLLPSSAASWQMISNTSISYGSTATTYGKVYANGSITDSGTAEANLYASGTITGSPTLEDGAVAYSSTSTPSFSQEITSPIDFSTFLNSISDTERAADVGGVDLTQATPLAAWEIVFQSNGTFTAAACSEGGGEPVWEAAPTCGAPTTYTMPSNGAIYSDQTIIVGGDGASDNSTVDGRVTVTSNADIVVGNGIAYQPGSNSILGLVAADDLIVAAWAPNDLTWSAATVAQSGEWTDACGMGDSSVCGTHGTMDFTGSTATDLGGSMSMFGTRNYYFDSTLLWLDPPWFPTIENPYTLLLQREIPPS